MGDELNQYSATSADWRRTLRQNSQRTYIVIALFFLIYTSIGVLIDLYLASANYPQVPLETLFLALVTGKIFPLATLLLIGIAALSLSVSYLLYDKLMLLGTEYKEITPQSATTASETQLYNAVEEMKIAAGLKYMPKVYVI